jgi:hypothetical protein
MFISSCTKICHLVQKLRRYSGTVVSKVVYNALALNERNIRMFKEAEHEVQQMKCLFIYLFIYSVRFQ